MDLSKSWEAKNSGLTGIWWKDRIKALQDDSKPEEAQALFSEYIFDGGNSPMVRLSDG